jgi:hypothetical protein
MAITEERYLLDKSNPYRILKRRGIFYYKVFPRLTEGRMAVSGWVCGCNV